MMESQIEEKKIGKTLSDWREESNYFSGKASETIRALAFGGLAIIWLFKHDSSSGPLLDFGFLIPLLLFAVALLFDLSHYVVGAIIWYRFLVSEEKKVDATEQKLICAPEWRRDVVSWLFYIKVFILCLAYIFLFISLVDRLF